MEHIGTFLVLVFWENLEMKEKDLSTILFYQA